MRDATSGSARSSLERGELLAAEHAARHERGARDGARKADDRRRPAQLHERVVAGRQRDRERGTLAGDERGEVVREPALAPDRRQVDVVVPRHDRHLDPARDFVEQAARLAVLALVRHVRDVARHDDVVGARGGLLEHGPQVLAPVDAPAPEDDVRPSRDPLVEKHAAPLGAEAGQDVDVGDVGDAQHAHHRVSSTSRTFCASERGVKGFCRNAVPASSTP